MNDPEEINPAQPGLRDNAVGRGVLVVIWFLLFAIATSVVIAWLIYKGAT